MKMDMIKAKVPFSPEEAGYDSSRLEVLDARLKELVEKKALQGAFYALSRHGKMFANRAIGKQSFREDDTRLIQPDSIRRIASISKFFTAASIMKLVEDGRLMVDSSVSRYIREFDNEVHRNIKIHHLLTHTSGLAPDGGVYTHPYPISPWDIMYNKDANRNWIESFLSVPMNGKPGERWQYSSLGFAVLAELLQKVTDMPIEDFVTKNILKPLGMEDSSYTPEQIDRIVTTKEYDEFWTQNDQDRIKIPSGGSGLYSTAPDLLKFGEMLCQKGQRNGVRILGRKTVEKMATNVLHNVPDFCWEHNIMSHEYGLGPEMKYGDIEFLYTPGTFGHEGSGFSLLIIDPVEELVATWFVLEEGWYPEAVVGVSNIIWSGIL